MGGARHAGARRVIGSGVVAAVDVTADVTERSIMVSAADVS